jgi:hypothetical protein
MRYALANAGHDIRAIQDWRGYRSIQHTGHTPDRSGLPINRKVIGIFGEQEAMVDRDTVSGLSGREWNARPLSIVSIFDLVTPSSALVACDD